MTIEQNVADIAASSLDAVRVFERYGIDYCCGGKRPLAEVCREKGLAPETLLSELTKERGTDRLDADWNSSSLSELIHHIVARHHEYLKSELPQLDQRLAKVVKVYGATPRLAGLPEVFAALRAELEMHLHKEEVILFPFIERLESGESVMAPCGWIEHPISMMEHEHDSAGHALRRIRAITADFEVPEGACVTYRSLLAGLEQMERDLHLHIHLENNILFPRALDRGR